jgi:hypothetical protein
MLVMLCLKNHSVKTGIIVSLPHWGKVLIPFSIFEAFKRYFRSRCLKMEESLGV